MEISEAEFERAHMRSAKRREMEPFAITAEFDKNRGMIAVALSNGVEVRFPAGRMQGLSGARAEDLAVIEIDPDGYGLSFPRLDADFSLPALLDGIFGSRKWMAAVSGAEDREPVSMPQDHRETIR